MFYKKKKKKKKKKKMKGQTLAKKKNVPAAQLGVAVCVTLKEGGLGVRAKKKREVI